jgi:hypothetical protein
MKEQNRNSAFFHGVNSSNGNELILIAADCKHYQPADLKAALKAVCQPALVRHTKRQSNLFIFAACKWEVNS